jgi:hypothetical protein
MQRARALIATGLAAALLAVCASSADARWYHRGFYGHGGYYGHGGPGLVGGVVLGAAAIATLPFAILGAATRPAEPAPPYYGPGYGPAPYGYAPPPPPPPPAYYRGYGPPPGYGYHGGY